MWRAYQRSAVVDPETGSTASHQFQMSGHGAYPPSGPLDQVGPRARGERATARPSLADDDEADEDDDGRSSDQTLIQFLLGFMVLLIILGVVPASLLFFLCLGFLVLACIRFAVQRDIQTVLQERLLQSVLGTQPRTPHHDALLQLLRTNDQFVVLTRPNHLPGALDHFGGQPQQQQLQHPYQYLYQVGALGARDITPSDYEALLSLDRPLARPISETDLLSLPVRQYTAAPRHVNGGSGGSSSSRSRHAKGAGGVGSLSPSGAAFHKHKRNGSRPPLAGPSAGAAGAAGGVCSPATLGHSTGSEGGTDSDREASMGSSGHGAGSGSAGSSGSSSPPSSIKDGAERAAPFAASAANGGGSSGAPGTNACGGGGCGGGGHSLVCSVCLESVAEGEHVMTLPCLHQFHQECITPWLRQQGKMATCPLCKTTVFH